jgi:ribosomal protein S18 acetylase RimI-like enzyme
MIGRKIEIPKREMPSPLMIREAREVEAATLVRLKKQVFAETDSLLQSLEDYDGDVEEERYLVRRYRNLENSVLILALEGREAVGFLTLQGAHLQRSRHVAQLGIAVRKDRWGQGIGRALMDQGLEWAEKNPIIQKISLMVYEENQRAIELYEKYGFEQEGLLKNEVLLRNREQMIHLVVMGLTLDDQP